MIKVPFLNTSQSWMQSAILILAGILFGLFRVHIVAAQSQQGGEEQKTQQQQNPPYQQYEVKAGEYIQIIDTGGRQCSDFLAFDTHKLNDGIESIICLLYTSPSPRDVEECRMPSSA